MQIILLFPCIHPLSTASNDVSDYAQVRFVTHLKTIAMTLVLHALGLSGRWNNTLKNFLDNFTRRCE